MSRLKSDMHNLLTETVLNALFANNIYTVLDFLQTEIKRIGTITALHYKDVVAVRKHLVNKHSAVVHTALDLWNELMAKTAQIPTRIKGVDGILQGGLTTGNIYEVCGLPSSGKTQLCLTLMKNVVSYSNLNVFWIDTKGDFAAKRIKAMLDASKADVELMSKMLVKRLHTQHELINTLYQIKEDVYIRRLKLRLIIIDSLPPLFYQSRDFERNYGVMNDFVNILHFLTRELHIAIVVTNVITTWYEGDFHVENSATEKLGLGKYWLQIANTRLVIKKRANSECTVQVMKSNRLPKGASCKLWIRDEGIV
ncbi:hypothetical protein PPYR_12486 [Photinus pyralis]|uniref:RecA family profile 1 domain-containing protein n=1 Tax=Photinus pyralis TaxID=7054 RepID=A0A1Y1LXQ1_PHOPY|nr:DNA repair protein RAD51 homolog 4-like [Photinus pyralis]KAB0795647.1 hypothetical protein PPYR_12486 [Photinus pyralis]